MREASIGRVLVASLHQGIADTMPQRLAFYESWLHAEGLRDGTIGLAPLYAVLSFLRQEGTPYDAITRSAGEYAAEWTVESMGPFERRLIRSAPAWIRPRLVLRLARRLVQDCFRTGRLTFRLRKGVASVELRESPFCNVRDPFPNSLCGFYVAAFNRLNKLFDIASRIDVVTCRGTGEPACTMTMTIGSNGSRA